MSADREPAVDTYPGPGQPGHVVTEGRVPGHLAVLARGGRDGRSAALAASRALLDDWED
ncbi:hypothetical protein FHX81_4139 [Saccharothrix saharensis]|uniref:Uncharacterized protein n=1 Tax=Saccharothrix saharensis TaxID=571190 RepID=A0A543JG15_9PSEU|nr:hypothetical protein [Saccharothrix saharensis]TQM81762.1 hypothetical protein FHX81_4139 [Saccharothrix saharensis]